MIPKRSSRGFCAIRLALPLCRNCNSYRAKPHSTNLPCRLSNTPLGFALRDCGITSVAIAGIAMEIGIEPTVRHAADLGFVPVVITDACGAGHADAAKRSLESLAFAGDALFTDAATFCRLVRENG